MLALNTLLCSSSAVTHICEYLTINLITWTVCCHLRARTEYEDSAATKGHVPKHKDEETLRKVISHQKAWRYCRKGAGEYPGTRGSSFFMCL